MVGKSELNNKSNQKPATILTILNSSFADTGTPSNIDNGALLLYLSVDALAI